MIGQELYYDVGTNAAMMNHLPKIIWAFDKSGEIWFTHFVSEFRTVQVKKLNPFLIYFFTHLKLTFYQYLCTSLDRWCLRLCGEKKSMSFIIYFTSYDILKISCAK